MKLTTKVRYAVTAMLDLSVQHIEAKQPLPVTLSDISQRQGISLSYLEQLFVKLRRSDLVRSVRGPGGGYCLNKPAQDIYILDVIEAVEEMIEARSCYGESNCDSGKVCLTHDLWSGLNDCINDFLRGVSLASLIEKKNSHNKDSDAVLNVLNIN
jgi:Rrf2 family transcriptional regulator, iron-sulfur cluster assembly transcription factor